MAMMNKTWKCCCFMKSYKASSVLNCGGVVRLCVCSLSMFNVCFLSTCLGHLMLKEHANSIWNKRRIYTATGSRAASLESNEDMSGNGHRNHHTLCSGAWNLGSLFLSFFSPCLIFHIQFFLISHFSFFCLIWAFFIVLSLLMISLHLFCLCSFIFPLTILLFLSGPFFLFFLSQHQ